MKTIKHLLCCAIAASALISTGVHAASWKDALSSAASELGNQNNTTQEGGWSLASLTNLLSNGNQALSADNMNNAAGILQYCAKQKLASVTDAENIKNQVLEKLGLNSEEQKEDTNYLDGIQGLLKTKDGQQLNLDNIGTTPLAEKVKTKACDLVLKQDSRIDGISKSGGLMNEFKRCMRVFSHSPFKVRLMLLSMLCDMVNNKPQQDKPSDK